jgi:3-oxoacyl-[acyl-carrier-protein] synthase-3
MHAPPIGIAATAIWLPQQVETAADIAHQTGIPESVIIEKMGVQRKYVAGPDDQPSQIAARAARQALDAAGLAPADVDLIIYHGSEYKDYFVWSAAAKIQHLIGATRAWAYEIYALCAGAPLALKVACDQMRSDPHLHSVLLVTAARENDLLDYANPKTRFMLNFGAGGAALLLRRGQERNRVLASAMLVDGSFSESVIMPGGGSRHPASHETVSQRLHHLDVPDLDDMRERLGRVSLSNFVRVIDEAVERSGARRSDIGFLIITHMKPSFHQEILQTLGLRPEQSLYLSEFGHMQSVDQPLGLHVAEEHGLLHNGDLVVLAGAGTGYTWSATALRWGQPPC